MEKVIQGKAYVLGNNIDTDQIIPAEHLVYSLNDEEESKKYGHFALSSVPLEQAGLPGGRIPFIDGDKWQSDFNIIIGGSNFGCGSSREHAPFALEKAGVKTIIAESYARIFYRNSVDGGFLIPYESPIKLNDKIKTGDQLEIDIENNIVKNLTREEEYVLNPLGEVFPIVNAGGLFNYARTTGMIS
ncbi:MAG: 3-isopropylmalate dehydratase [Ignavibacteriae bacterium HGW-Ignavibacteriae-2]|jgi:3-isopropylmalate/(R)-2-methylmalate dehydratase small subunit|nr:MAG: 3-isopropylmalate dehydratase [Ignavibacteriae bacterium HGW-Ignavibacteriae-2]